MPLIAVLPGDGVGPEVVDAALAVLEAVGLEARYERGNVGHACYQASGNPLPEDTLKLVTRADAVLFGAVTTPPEIADYPSAILELRRHFDLYANLRPVRTFPGVGRYGDEGVDVLLVRENTEGLYVQLGWREGDRAYNLMRRSETACRRIVQLACQQAQQRGQGLIVAHKANVVKPADSLWVEVAQDVLEAYEMDAKFEIVDALCTKLVLDPASYGVIVAPNFYGDILSDLLAGVSGSLGLCPSVNLGETRALFEPVHGSAPDLAGKGIANPTGAILSAAALLDYLGQPRLKDLVGAAVDTVISAGVKTPDMGGQATTDAFTHAVIESLADDKL